jgi:hypothetical protein
MSDQFVLAIEAISEDAARAERDMAVMLGQSGVRLDVTGQVTFALERFPTASVSARVDG